MTLLVVCYTLVTSNFNITSLTNQNYALHVQKYLAIEAVFMALCHKVTGVRFFDSVYINIISQKCYPNIMFTLQIVNCIAF